MVNTGNELIDAVLATIQKQRDEALNDAAIARGNLAVVQAQLTKAQARIAELESSSADQ